MPDIEKCASLAAVYGVTIDSLIKTESCDGIGRIPPAPTGKNIWGTVTPGDRGQLVILKSARDKFSIKGGDRIVVLSDDNGIALIPAVTFEEQMKAAMEVAKKPILPTSIM